MTSTSARPDRAYHDPPAHPFTGQEFLASLRDDREVWIYGERVRDVTAHPAFRTSSRMLARLYDALHDPRTAPRLTTTTDTGSGGRTHRFFRAPATVADLRGDRDAIAAWQRQCWGWLGRTPDYKASFLATLGAQADFYSPFDDNARRWYAATQERVLHVNHALVHPPVDRHRPPSEVEDVYVHVERETDAGLVVSGAKVVATGSALTHHTFIAHHGVPVQDRRFALAFLTPTATPGLKLFCRASYELAAHRVGSPFDYPLSSRMDENDAVVVFDRALIPWENVLVYGDTEKANTFFHRSGFLPRFALHAATRLATKLDFLCGLLIRAAETNGTDDREGIRASIGEVMTWRHTIWALSDAMVASARPWGEGHVLPAEEYALAYRVLAPTAYGAVRGLIQQTVGSGLIYLTSHASDFDQDEVRPYLERYLRGSRGGSAEQRVKLMKLLWDAVGSEFAGRHELYERSHAGRPDENRMQVLDKARTAGLVDSMMALVDDCMSDYDLHGWTAADLAGD